MLNISVRFYENGTFTFREITASGMNEPTDQQTRLIIIPPDSGIEFKNMKRSGYVDEISYLHVCPIHTADATKLSSCVASAV